MCTGSPARVASTTSSWSARALITKSHHTCLAHAKPFHDRVTSSALSLGKLCDFWDNFGVRFAVPCLTPRDTNSEADAAFDTAMFFFVVFLSPRGRLLFNSGRRRPQHSSRSGLIPAADSRGLPRWRERTGRNCCQDKIAFLSTPQLCSSAATSRQPAMRFSSSFTSIARACEEWKGWTRSSSSHALFNDAWSFGSLFIGVAP